MDLDHINYELNIQKSNLLLLKEYLNKMNILIQEDDSYDNSFKFMEMLKELKINMDNTKANISNLTVLRTLLLNLQISSENESDEELEENSKEDSNEEVELNLDEVSNSEKIGETADNTKTVDTSIKPVEEKIEKENEKESVKEVISENASNENPDNKSNIKPANEVKDNSSNNSNVKPTNNTTTNNTTTNKKDSKKENSSNAKANVKPEQKEEIKEENKKEPKNDESKTDIKEQNTESALESSEEKKIEFYEEISEVTSENVSENISEEPAEEPQESKSQEQIVTEYYEECFEILEKNFVVFYAFLLNYINSCELSEDYYLSELSKEKQYAIEFIQNELMEKEPEDEKEESEPKQEKHFTDERPVVDVNPFMKNVENDENLEEVVITNNSNNKENEDDSKIGILIISEKDNKVILPYTEEDIKKILDETTEFTSLEQIIDAKYTIPLERYKNPGLARFRETYNLMKKRQKASMADSLDLALELAFNSSLNPAIITACKNLEQLDSYLTCAELNEIDKFEYFKIKYEMLPMKK